MPSPRRRLVCAAVAASLAGSALIAGTIAPASAADPIPTGTVSGTVTADGGAPIPNAVVTLHRQYLDGPDAPYFDDYRSGSTGPSGEFVVGRLPAGVYKAEFSANGYQTEFYVDQPDLAAGAEFAVGQGNTPLQAEALTPDASPATVGPGTDISGKVVDAATGAPIYDVFVRATDATTGNFVDQADTDAAGNYVLDGLDGHAAVKVVFSRFGNSGELGYLPVWSGGARTIAGAAAVALTPGTPVTLPASLTPASGISGRVLNPAGVAAYDGYAEAYDADGAFVGSTYVRDGGAYFFGGLNPGEQYKVRVTSAYDYPNGDYENDIHFYLDSWYGNAGDFTTATAVTTAPGRYTPNIDVTLGDSLVALQAPSISGTFQIGKTLTGDKGRWNRSGGSTFGYEWLRGGTVVGTGTTYRLTAADAGQSVALRVTNTNISMEQQRVATATTRATVAKYAAKVSGKAKKLKKSGATRVTITVKAAGQAAKKVTGKVQVFEGKKKVAVAKVKKGKAGFVLKKAKPGKHTYTVKYAGNKTTLAVQGKVKIKVKK